METIVRRIGLVAHDANEKGHDRMGSLELGTSDRT